MPEEERTANNEEATVGTGGLTDGNFKVEFKSRQRAKGGESKLDHEQYKEHSQEPDVPRTPEPEEEHDSDRESRRRRRDSDDDDRPKTKPAVMKELPTVNGHIRTEKGTGRLGRLYGLTVDCG